MKNKYPDYIIRDVRQCLDVEADDTSMDSLIDEMPKGEVLNKVLEWNGIIGYDTTIKNWIEDIYKVELIE